MLRGLVKHNQVNGAVLYSNRVLKCVREAMDAAPWADVFAAVSAFEQESPVEIQVIPFMSVPSSEEAEAFEAKWPGAQVSWFQRQPKEQDDKGRVQQTF